MSRPRLCTRRTKIVCTIGPATGSSGMIEKLVKAGMNVARLNLSHGTFEEHAAYVQTVKSASKRLGMVVAVLLDLPGPKYRTGKLKGHRAILKKGALLSLTSDQIEGDETRVSVNLPYLTKDARPGDTVLLDDGAIMLKIQRVEGNSVECRIKVGGILTEGRGLVVPGMRNSGPFVTDALRNALRFAVSQRPDYLGLSFVNTADDIVEARKLIAEHDGDLPIIAKIETGEAVKNFSGILVQSDGVMVARGDLGVEMPLERIPVLQKDVIQRCNRAGKPVITATQMLESMVKSSRPTRAETTDVANAIFDGTDATMLSEETSVGEYPIQAVAFMDRIARQAEKRLPFETALYRKKTWLSQKTEELISYDACLTAYNLNARAIVAFTSSGSTAARVSKYRPHTTVLAMTHDEKTCRRLMLYWAVQPVQIDSPSSISALFAKAVALAKESGLAKPGDLLVITGGVPLGLVGTTNLLKVELVR